MKPTSLLFTTPLLASLLMISCGKPPSGGGREGGGAVNAVVAEATGEAVQNTLQLVGSLQAINEIDVTSETSGTITDILFSEGDTATAGQVLIRLDDAKIKAQRSEAKSRFDLAKTNLERARTLFESETISQQEYDTAKAEFDATEAAYQLLNENLKDTVIKAPFEGIIGERMVSPGQFVTSGQAMTRLVQVKPLEARFRVPEVQLAHVAIGQEIRMKASAFPDREIQGSVFFIDPFVDQASRTVLVKANVANEDFALKPGLFGTIDLVLSVHDGAVVIPEASVRYSGDQASIVVMNQEGLAEFRNVTLGTRMSNRVEVTSGIAAGERVVVEGHQKIFAPGTPIAISPDSAVYGLQPEQPTAEPTVTEE